MRKKKKEKKLYEKKKKTLLYGSGAGHMLRVQGCFFSLIWEDVRQKDIRAAFESNSASHQRENFRSHLGTSSQVGFLMPVSCLLSLSNLF